MAQFLGASLILDRSGILMGYTLPCRRSAALDFLGRVERSLGLERLNALVVLIVVVAVPGLLLPSARLTRAAEALLEGLFTLGAAAAGASAVWRTMLLGRLRRLRARLEALGVEELPQDLCSVELRRLLSGAG